MVSLKVDYLAVCWDELKVAEMVDWLVVEMVERLVVSMVAY